MKVQIRIRFIVAIIACLLIEAKPARGSVLLNDGGVTNLEVAARDTHISINNQIENLFPTGLPFSGNHTAVHGNSNSHANYELDQDGFIITSLGNRDGLLDSRANVQPIIYFSVSVDTQYRLAGTLSVDDPDNNARFTQMDVSLTDIDIATVLFHNLQESSGIVDEVFELGGIGGNINNELAGSLAGTLLAGHRYRLFYGTSIYADSSGDPADFVGTFEMSLVPASAVPEASALLTWTLLGSIAAAVACHLRLGQTLPFYK
jgi:hypothetical protein